jgi:hypothetical protein
MANAETRRLHEDARRVKNWKRWGPYLSERQWATVREDYSPDGRLWEGFPYEQSLARAYRWGEDGLPGVRIGSAVCASRWRTDSARRDEGTKAAAVYVLNVGAGAERSIDLRLAREDEVHEPLFADFDRVLLDRKAEADGWTALVAPLFEYCIRRRARAERLEDSASEPA